ncbi:MAG: hypothetical protein ACI93R_003580 [Flavobacteriales bacterium]|jgi:hypothetical protein
MVILEKDLRHKNIQVLIDDPIKDRSFQNWNMDSFNLSDTECLDKEELLNISKIFKQSVTTRSSLLARFYKAMLLNHELKDM